MAPESAKNRGRNVRSVPVDSAPSTPSIIVRRWRHLASGFGSVGARMWPNSLGAPPAWRPRRQAGQEASPGCRERDFGDVGSQAASRRPHETAPSVRMVNCLVRPGRRSRRGFHARRRRSARSGQRGSAEPSVRSTSQTDSRRSAGCTRHRHKRRSRTAVGRKGRPSARTGTRCSGRLSSSSQ